MNFPTKNNRVTSKYGWRDLSGRLDYHSGIDCGCLDNNNPTNDGIYAIEDGVVRVSKMNEGGYGHYVVVEHDGYCSLYAHLKQRLVRVGDSVKAGDIVGNMGNTGNSFGIHLHFEIRDVEYGRFWERWSNSEPRHAVNPKCFMYIGMNESTEVIPEEIAELLKQNIEMKQILDSINKISEV